MGFYDAYFYDQEWYAYFLLPISIKSIFAIKN